MTTTRVGTNIDSNSAGKSTSAITTVNVGDVVVLWTQVNSATIYASAMTSARITWTHVDHWFGPSPMTLGLSLHIGIVNSVGADTITATYSASIGTTLVQWTAAQFHTDTGLDWQIDNSQFGTAQNASAGTTMALPALTSTGTGRLGVGIMVPQNTGTNGATAGWTYPTRDGFTSVWPYNLAVGSGAWTPAAATMTSGRYISAGAILVPASGSTNSGAMAGTAPQAAGAVAGVLGDPAAVAGASPRPSGTLAALVHNTGAVAGASSRATGTLAGQLGNFGAMVGQSAHPGAALVGSAAEAVGLSGIAPSPTGALAGDVRDLGVLAGAAPRATGQLFSGGVLDAVLAATVPAAVGRLRTTRRPFVAAGGPGGAVLLGGPVAAGSDGDRVAELETGPVAAGTAVLT